MTAPDFTGWRERWPLTPTLHQLAEPKSVVVEMNRALPLAKNAQRPDRLLLRVLAGGLRLEGTMPGDLDAWARLSDGQWLCCVKIHATTGDASSSTKSSPISLSQVCRMSILLAKFPASCRGIVP